MASISETIASLANPTPKLLDPEDDVNIETTAKIDNLDANADETSYKVSELRSKTAPLLEDVDPFYAGKKVSRKSLGDIFLDESKSDDDNCEDISDSEESDESKEMSGAESGLELSDNDLENFKNAIKSNNIDSQDEQDNEADLDEQDKETDSDEQDKEADSDESEESEGVESADDMVNRFSNIDVTSEIEKGEAVKAQQEIWNRLCECRIKMQKLLVIVNKLPQPNCWNVLKQKGGKDISEGINKSSGATKLLLNSCLDLQAELLQNIPDVNIAENNKVSNEDEEIPSDSEEEMEKPASKEQSDLKKLQKRKLKCDSYGDILTKRHKSLLPYRNSVIQKWDEKTRLSTGKVTQKSFAAFDTSAVKQIEQILQDETRLIKRTQLKRSLYRIIGKPEVSEAEPSDKKDENEVKSKQDMFLKDYDPEIFDDDDFYRQLLKDVIESKSVGIDPAVLRKQIEIQNVRNKMKKKVDTKASKGRKIRYDVHPKLVNFMAPIETSTISDEARDNLLKCIFGRNSVKS